MFKFNNKDARRRSGIFIVNFEHVIAGWEEIILAYAMLTTYVALHFKTSFLPCSTKKTQL